MLTFIHGETQDDLLRIAMDLPKFLRIPKEGHITDYSKAESMVRLTTLRYFSTQFVIHFVAFYYDMTTWNKFIVAFFFLEGFSAKQQKTPKKKEIIAAL